MVDKNLLNRVLNLPAADRLDLVHRLWDSLLEDPKSLWLSDDQKQELDRLYEQYLKDPTEGSTWEEVEVFVRARL
ncbi:MAG: addiction module component [Phycisphaerales bacterium]|jgi:putative addiction module component (TIGR02574 family)|nr:addiction module component [Phycisphaerales bacterium]